MHPGDPVTIPYPIPAFRQPLPLLHGGETGVFLRTVMNGLGEEFCEVEINGHIYPLREEEFSTEER
jgi:hypothetical protein